MRTRIVAVLVVVMLVAADKADKPDKGAAKTDLDKLSGTWRVSALTVNGAKPPAALLKDLQVVFEGTKMALKPGLEVVLPRGPRGGMEFRKGNPNGNVSTVKLNSTKKPATIDLTIDGNTRKGIYELDGGNLKICYRTRGDRPTEFASKAGGGQTLLVLKREK